MQNSVFLEIRKIFFFALVFYAVVVGSFSVNPLNRDLEWRNFSSGYYSITRYFYTHL